MAPITTASNDATHAALLDQLDTFRIAKPFRNPSWRPPQRRNKNLKQILSEAARRADAASSALATSTNPSGAVTPSSDSESARTPGLSSNPAQGSKDLARAVLEKAAASAPAGGAPPSALLAQQQPSYTWTSVAAAPSFRPRRRYCDITGLPASYVDPKTGLRYANKEVYAVVRGLGTGTVQEYLAARGANTVLK